MAMEPQPPLQGAAELSLSGLVKAAWAIAGALFTVAAVIFGAGVYWNNFHSRIVALEKFKEQFPENPTLPKIKTIQAEIDGAIRGDCETNQVVTGVHVAKPNYFVTCSQLYKIGAPQSK